VARRWFALGASLALVLAACGTGETTSAPAGSGGPVATTGATEAAATPASVPLTHDPDTLVVAVDAFSGDFDPASSYVLSQALIWRGIYESLIRLKGDSASEVEPLLADTWEANTDRSSWTFHLRPDVKFTDGEPVDAAAVKANFIRNITIGLGTNFIVGSFIPDPETQIVVVDPLTVRFDIGAPTPHFDLVIAAQNGTQIVSPKAYTEHSTGPTDQGHEWLATHAIGTGPYVLDTFSPGDQVILKQNPDYWRGWDGAHFKTIIIRSIPESATRRQLLESGEVDIAYAGTPEDTAALRADPRFFVGDFKNLQMNYIALGEYGPLEKPEARQAMNYLFPHEDFLSSVVKGTYERAHGVFPDLLATHDNDVFEYTTDIEKAKALFAQAGVAPGTEMTYEYYTGFGGEAGVILQGQMEKAGMKLRLIEKEYSAFNADLTTDRPVAERANMYFWGWWPDYNAPSNFAWIILNSGAAPDACPCYNSGYYKNDRVDEIINAGFSETDDAKLEASFKEMQDIAVRQDPAWIPVGQPLDETYFRSDIKGQVFSPLYILSWDFYALSRG
jgi:peptide/nickel transport system substrate-binding protein